MCAFQVDALRLRLEEKETTLNKKSKQIQEMSEEKGTLNGEIHDLKDMLDVKERKVNVLQKKVKAVADQFLHQNRIKIAFYFKLRFDGVFVFDTNLFKDPSRTIVVANAFVNIDAPFKRMSYPPPEHRWHC